MRLVDAEFPRQQARTRRFTLGRPRSLRVASDGSRIAFLRSRAGDDPVNCLWVYDVGSGESRLGADPGSLIEEGPEELPDAERARRERARESAGGIVAFGADALVRVATFALSGRVYRADLVGGGIEEVPVAGAAVEVRPDPCGRRIAYVCGPQLRVVGEHGDDTALGPDNDDADVTWGLAEFVAAEEMGRSAGYWWSPEGDRLAVARVDQRAVRSWYLADPSDPGSPPRTVRYPAAGTVNADVALLVVGVDGSVIEARWDRGSFPYLARVEWKEGCPLTLLVQSRDQRTTQVLTVDPAGGATDLRREDHDDVWLDLVSGVPTWTRSGALVVAAHVGDRRRVLVDGEPVTPATLDVREVVAVGDDIVFTASEEPAETHVWRVEPGQPAEPLTADAGVHSAAAGGDVVAVTSLTLDADQASVTLWRRGSMVGTIPSLAERPVVSPAPRLLRAGPREVRTAVLLPASGGDGPLPVLLDPYGGPSHQRVVASRPAFAEAQWLANQGFAVVVADGRGTGGRGRAWDRSLYLDLASPPLEDQVEALHAAARAEPRLDLERVAIRGWSFGGYLAALAVLRRPDVFHAAVAGAPVTDWRLYDTHYTERYLGHPDEHPEAYRASSLLDDAAGLERPLLLIHGLDDDNVVVAHTLRLSRALFEHGCHHEVLPLSGVTHMTSREVVAENLLGLQVRFLRQALGVEPPHDGEG